MTTTIIHTGRIKTPTNGDVGYDLYFDRIDSTDGLCKDGGKTVLLYPSDSIKIGTGVRTQTVMSAIRKKLLSLVFGAPVHLFPKIQDRSGLAANEDFKTSAGILDPRYTGEVVVKITNIGNEIRSLTIDQRICQFILIPCVMAELKEVSDQDFDFESTRGADGFGSSGKF